MTDDPLIGAILDGKYRLDALIGTGGMGAVYRAEQLALGRTVAVKVIRSAAASSQASEGRFRREALAVAKFKHPNIVAVYDFGIAEATGAYLVMEYLEGRSLRDEVLSRGPLDVDETAEILTAVCAAIQASHDAGILHRDLKPQNIFLETRAEGRAVKVLDFGLAKLFDRGSEKVESTGDGTQTALGIVVGTPLFMSPEQWLGDPLDARSDVYSLGCILFEMLAGHPPFWDAARRDLLARKLVGAPRGAHELPGSVTAVLDRSLAPTPSDRFGSASALGEALTSAVRGPRSAADPSDSSPAAPASRPPDPGALSNLPRPLTSFVGRAAEIVEVARALDSYGIVTLTGPGGVGKTRLAVEVARGLERFNPGGIWFVDLSGLSEPDFVESAVADALGLPGEGGLRAVRDALGGERALFVLDNCEHVLGSSARFVAELVSECPQVRVLVTSREPLHVPGEQVRAIAGLPLVRARKAIQMERRESDAVRLFIERVRLVKPTFVPTGQDVAAITGLCERLECLPLAIELAAACSKVLTVDEILKRLGDRFRLLTGGGRTTAPRHRTLRATIDWSYDHLSEDDRAFLRRISIFAGGWTLEAAEAAASPQSAVSPATPARPLYSEQRTAGGGQLTADVLQHLERLVDKSLVIAEDRDGATRYRMLETIREYSREKLEASGEAERVAVAHRDWFLSFAERGIEGILGPGQEELFKTLGQELDNFRAALRWGIERDGDRERTLRLATALFRFFEYNGRPSEGCQWIEAALAMTGDALPELEAGAHFGLAMLRFTSTDYAQARAAIETCVRLREEVGDRAGVAKALNLESLVLNFLGDIDRSVAIQEEALALSREFGLEASISQGIFHLGMLATARGDYDAAAEHLEESASRWRAVGNRLGAAGALLNLCEVERIRGNLDLASVLVDECLAIGRSHDARRLIAGSCAFKGYLLALGDDEAGARRYFAEAVAIYREMGSTGGLVDVIEMLALAFAARGQAALAVRLVAASGVVREEIGYPRDPSGGEELAALVAAVRLELGDASVAEEEAAGRVLGVDAAVDAALAAFA